MNAHGRNDATDELTMAPSKRRGTRATEDVGGTTTSGTVEVGVT